MDLPKLNINKEQRSLEDIKKDFLKIKEELAIREAAVDKQPPVPQEDKSGIYGSIPKKVCAIEVLKHLKTAKWVGMGAIAGVFIVLLGSTFAIGMAYAASFLMIVPAAVYLQKVQREIKRLEIEYDLGKKQGKNGRV